MVVKTLQSKPSPLYMKDWISVISEIYFFGFNCRHSYSFSQNYRLCAYHMQASLNAVPENIWKGKFLTTTPQPQLARREHLYGYNGKLNIHVRKESKKHDDMSSTE